VEQEKIETLVTNLIGQVHGLFIMCQMLANAHPRPGELLSQLDEIEQVGLANIEHLPIQDAAIGGFRFVMAGVRKAVEAAAKAQQ
jgi:hypothetical protein